MATVMGVEMSVSVETHPQSSTINLYMPKHVNGQRKPRLDVIKVAHHRVSFSSGIYWGGWIEFESDIYFPKSPKALLPPSIPDIDDGIPIPIVRWGDNYHRYIYGDVTGDIPMFQKQMLALKLIGDEIKTWEELQE
jgi:hypothetical protein